MKKIFTVGVYDLLHAGHVLLFKRAKQLGDELIVAVQDSDFILKYKPGTKIINSTEERMFMVDSVRYVDRVVSYQDVDSIITAIDFDVFVKGPDQTHQGFQKATQWCLDHHKAVVVLPRTDGVSSTILRGFIGEGKSNG
ncbi:adenylyltransferase/cytidyltransferase family protein [Alistipes sp. kh20]|uniref:adenylyltransferase/cytidyltransferase family protein n=1 Tax=Alistipes montrealensis TaxID=2834113 RepID=UPI001BCCBB62|nr:adenylyltransferase/cytidyltransferase family protein [Alistipes montrealensis]MBS4766345.1 adenylyltransferase/cytidyltransferase family protein [Alistipes montrealensis]